MRWRVTASPPRRGHPVRALGPQTATRRFPSISPCSPGASRPARTATALRPIRDARDLTRGAPPYRLVRAVHDSYGALSGSEFKRHTLKKPFALVVFPRPANDMVYVNIQDRLAADGPYNYPRTFEQAMWPTNGLASQIHHRKASAFRRWIRRGVPARDAVDRKRTLLRRHPANPVGRRRRAMAQTRIATLPEVVTPRRSSHRRSRHPRSSIKSSSTSTSPSSTAARRAVGIEG